MKYLKHYLSKKTVLCIVASFVYFFSIPQYLYAATISASSTDAIASGDTSIIHVYLNTEGETINSIDGTLSLSDEHGGNFEVKELSLVNSVFKLWPNKPSLGENHTIKFIGGTPGGVMGDRLLLFKVVVKINQAGVFTVTPKSTAYLNDGIPTPRSITKDVSSIVVGTSSKNPQDKWKEIVSNDNTAPAAFTVHLISDPYLYGGKKFISFETTDSESGISYYEVQEGDRAKVRSGTEYVLIDQNNTAEITVTAYDKAGNFQVSILKASEPIHWLSIIGVLSIFGVLYFIIKKLKRKKK